MYVISLHYLGLASQQGKSWARGLGGTGWWHSLELLKFIRFCHGLFLWLRRWDDACPEGTADWELAWIK
uniref:Acyl_transf_3 domain-containing protein n=1 Tax=Panagrellus redivivus TaxID=6233 RepID=A0A7E5A162_PANRE